MSQLMVMTVDRSSLLLHKQGQEPAITADEIREFCLKSDHDRYVSHRYSRPIHWHGVRRSNALACCEQYPSVFEEMIGRLDRGHDWQRQPYVLVVHLSPENEVVAHPRSQLSR